MRKSFAGGIALIILGGAMVAGVRAAKNDIVPRTREEKAFADLAKVLDEIGQSPGVLGGGDATDCDITGKDRDTCTIHVNIIQTYDAPNGGAPFGCVLKVDNVKVINTVTKINWRLYMLSSASAPESAASPVSAPTPYTFYPKFQILVVHKDDADQIAASAVANSDGSVSMDYKWRAKGHHVKYYPVVAQNLGPDLTMKGKVQKGGTEKSPEVLCGSLDPKIVNN